MNLLLRRRALLKILKKVFGIPPLVLEDTNGENVVDYKIDGNSIQNGTPTPDTPIDVESVGEKTINLYEQKKDAWGNYVGLPMLDLEKDYYTLQIKLKEGKNVPSGAYFGFQYDSAQAKWLVQNGELKFNIMAVDTNTLNVKGVACYPQSKSEEIWDAFDIFLVRGNYTSTTIPSYEPFGYKVPVVAQGKNLFNIDNYGVLLDANKFAITLDISQYPIGTKLTVSTKDKYIYKICSTAGGSAVAQSGGTTNHFTFTITQKMIDAKYLFIISKTTYKAETKENLLTQNVQVEFGDTATDFEPYQEPIETNIYLDEPLRGIDSHRDCIDFANGRVVRNIGSTYFTKSTSYIPSKKSEVCWFSMDVPNSAKHIADTKILCKLLKPLQENWWINDEGTLSHKTNTGGFYYSLKWERLGLVYDGTNVYRVEDVEKTTPLTDTDLYDIVAEWLPNAFTKDERTAYYVRSTPTEELIDLPQSPTLKGTTVYTIDTTIQPSNMEISYYS